MSRVSSNIRDVTAAQRGQIIQHVLVDGWSPAQAAAVYGIAERQVVRWVGAYRRHGMASLRDDAAAEPTAAALERRLRTLAARIVGGAVRRSEAAAGPLHRAAPRQSGRGPQPDPGRRSLWN